MISRNLLEKYFADDPRLMAEFEEQDTAISAAAESVAAGVAATEALKDAAVIVLSPNSEFTNERLLQVGEGIDIRVTSDKVILSAKNVARTQDFDVLMTPTNDTEVGLPETGTLLSDKAIPTLPNAVDDVAAAAAGVAVGAMYRNGSVLMVRVV